MVQGVDYRIPMSAKGLDLNGAIDHYYKYQQNKRQNALLDLTERVKNQALADAEKAAQEAERQRIEKSIAGFALQIQPYLEAGDAAGAQRIYNGRIKWLQDNNRDPSDSMELAPYLMSGDLESANIMAKNAIQYGREMGYLNAPSKADGFTLSEGQQRFDAQGNLIAGVDKKTDGGKGFDQEGKLRGEFTKLTDDFRKQNAAFGRIQASVNDPSPAGDLALVFNFMKVLDPGSTVREGEFDNAASAKAELARAEEDGVVVPNFIKSALDRLTKGTILLPEQRKDFYGRAQALYKDAKDQYSLLQNRYTNLSTAYELDPSRVVMDFATADMDKQINFGSAAPEDVEALEWAKANPNDPRAQKILQVNQ